MDPGSEQPDSPTGRVRSLRWPVVASAAAIEYPGVDIDEVAFRGTSIAGVTTSTSAFIGTHGSADVFSIKNVESVTDFEQEFDAQDSPELAAAVSLFFANGGSEAWVVGVPEGASPSEGLEKLDAVDTINVLCLPGETEAAVLAAALVYAERRRAFVIVDPPDADVDEAIALSASLAALPASASGAVYFPPILVDDAPRPPTGAIAGVYARLDQARGVWKAPAGADAVLEGVTAPAVELTQAAVEQLHAAAVNPVRRFTNGPAMLWGARTLQGAETSSSDWKYISVRRLFLYIEESVDRGTRWAVFEPNDEPLWAALRRETGAFLNSLWRAGAMQGNTPRDAYFVHCGPNTMTQDDIDNGRLTILIGAAPVKPAEFVVIRIGQWRSGSSRELFDGTGQPSQRLSLQHRPLSADRVVLDVQDAGTWTTWREVPEVGDAGLGDRVFAVDRESGEVTFGDGEHGATPPSGGQNIRVTYRHGAGGDDD